MRRIGLLAGMLLCATTAYAETISLEYKGFYERLKQVNKGSFQLVELAFSVPMLANCKIEKGSISNELSSLPLTIGDNQRLFIPLDDGLKEQRTSINLDFAGSAQGCGIAMQVRAKQPSQRYDKARLTQLVTEMDSMLAKLQGFPMRYFSAPIAGLHFKFGQTTVLATQNTAVNNGVPPQQPQATVTIDGKSQVINDNFNLSLEALHTLSTLEFSEPPQIVSPWVK
ncbi:DUF2987 domain-containing protein [Shewanella acanthi]|uniref:DUF2987 domain-containing protein n=1 Tax=Shewanella acanthi TaxID=2864212 RepID=UPI001C6611E2|nr:DUF2987 domain-containing protein [Shewanella acanthi]QYJ80449.1 DUF2987 domain-containing protein [Shewanella acanthi]